MTNNPITEVVDMFEKSLEVFEDFLQCEDEEIEIYSEFKNTSEGFILTLPSGEKYSVVVSPI